jgi:hypothetical protein
VIQTTRARLKSHRNLCEEPADLDFLNGTRKRFRFTTKKVEEPFMLDTSAASHTVTEPQFAVIVGLSVAFLRELRRQGRVPHIRINRRVLYLKVDADRFLEQHRAAAVEVGA